MLAADAAHEAGDDAAARHDVEHRDLLGDAQRMVAQRDGVAEDGDLGAAGAAHQRRGHQVGRRHRAVGVLVVLVDAQAVEAELLGVLQLVEVLVVEPVAALRVVDAVGQRHPRRVVGAVEVAPADAATA